MGDKKLEVVIENYGFLNEGKKYLIDRERFIKEGLDKELLTYPTYENYEIILNKKLYSLQSVGYEGLEIGIGRILTDFHLEKIKQSNPEKKKFNLTKFLIKK